MTEALCEPSLALVIAQRWRRTVVVTDGTHEGALPPEAQQVDPPVVNDADAKEGQEHEGPVQQVQFRVLQARGR